MNGGITLNVALLDGVNSHHIAEACFKAVAQALRAAVEPDPRSSRHPLHQGHALGMTTVIVDYASGNLHSALKSFQRMAAETGRGGPVVGHRRPRGRPRAPTASCCPASAPSPTAAPASPPSPASSRRSRTRVIRQGAPFLGICVGQQMMAEPRPRARPRHPGLRLDPRRGGADRPPPTRRSRSRTWAGTRCEILAPHPLLDGIASGDHAYFVHSYHLVPEDPAHRLATVDHGGPITAIVGARQPRRHPVPPGEEPGDRPAPDRQLPGLASRSGQVRTRARTGT